MDNQTIIVYSVNMRGLKPSFFGLKQDALKTYNYLKTYYDYVSLKSFTEQDFIKYLFSNRI